MVSKSRVAMPYQNIDELPPGIRRVLPRHAQEIFLAAYNNSWEEYQAPGTGTAGRVWKR